MRRKLYTFFSAASLMLCLAVCALWVRSYFVSDEVIYNAVASTSGRCDEYWLGTDRGRVRYVHTVRAFDTAAGVQWYLEVLSFRGRRAGRVWLSRHAPATKARSGDTAIARMGFEWGAFDSESKSVVRLRPATQPVGMMSLSGRALSVPHWFAVLLLAVLPLRSLKTFDRRRRRSTVGRCPTCGYDLRESPDGCPECGAGRATA